MIFKLAWRNLWRNKSRTGITIASVFFAVLLSVMLTAIQRGAMQNLMKGVVSFYSSYIQVHKKGYFDEQTLDNVLDLNGGAMATIKAQKNVTLVSPRLESFALGSTGESTEGCMVVGILPSNEKNLIQLAKKVKSGTYMADTDTGIMIAEGLANKLNLKVNDTLVLLGQGYEGVTAAAKYPVRTILSYGSPQLNSHLLYMPLWQAQQFLSADDKATSLVISVSDENLVNEIKSGLQKSLPSGYEVITWQQMIPDIVQLVKSKEASEFVVVLLLYMLVSFGIFATLLMMMNERKFEMGMLMGIGMKKGKLAQMILLETIFVSVVGCIAGLAASIPVAYFFKSHPLHFGGQLKQMYESLGFEATIPTSTDPSIFYNQFVTIIIISLLLGIYPVFRIFRMNALNAMKK